MADDAVGFRPGRAGKVVAVGGVLGRCLRRAAAWFGIGGAGRRPAMPKPDGELRDSAGGLPWWAETYMSALPASDHTPPARKPARRPARRSRSH
jgi:hypothetical protein